MRKLGAKNVAELFLIKPDLFRLLRVRYFIWKIWYVDDVVELIGNMAVDRADIRENVLGWSEGQSEGSFGYIWDIAQKL